MDTYRFYCGYLTVKESGLVLRATAGVEARLVHVESVLARARVQTVAAEWRCADEPVEEIAGDGAPALFTSLGQMSTWVHDALDADVSCHSRRISVRFRLSSSTICFLLLLMGVRRGEK